MVGQGKRAEAMRLLEESGSVDLHLESFIWTRALGYDLTVAHGAGPLRGIFMSQSDLPRLARSGLTASVQSIATMPARTGRGRVKTLVDNVRRLRRIIDSTPGFSVVSDTGGYRRARSRGEHACFLAVQGGNAFEKDTDLDLVEDGLVTRITLVHMSDSGLGRTSNPLGGLFRPRGLTAKGAGLVSAMNARRIIVDLAHIHEQGFRDALDVHDRSLPPIVSHTGVRGVHDSWRNLADWQIRAIADRGGVVGVFVHAWALAPWHRGAGVAKVVEHMEHVICVGGEQCAALGSDLDGLIVPPSDMRSIDRLWVLVERMMDRSWSEKRIRLVLGQNFSRVLADVRR